MCSSGKCGACKACGLVSGLLFVLVAVASAIGVYMTHVTPAGWVFGTTEASMALIAFSLAVFFAHKTFRKMCGCGKGCGSGCGGGCGGCGAGGCDCGTGACSGCGKEQCVCK